MSEDAFRAKREDLLLRLLVRATRMMTDETVERMQARGIEKMQASYPRLLGNLDTEGTRLTALARRMGVSRQAAAQLAAEIETNGFVSRQPDPEDGRGVIVAFTPHGRKALAIAVEVMISIERDYENVVGKMELRVVKRHLRAILEKFDPEGGFGRD